VTLIDTLLIDVRPVVLGFNYAGSATDNQEIDACNLEDKYTDIE